MTSTRPTARAIPRVGDALPPIALPDLDGRNIHLHEYHGQRLLVFMWASW
jgi:peroxiredoxin